MEEAGRLMDIILFLLVLHWCLYAPYFLYSFSGHPYTKPGQRDTVATEPDGIPYYHMGVLVCYLERER